jgi:hypothetical protein
LSKLILEFACFVDKVVICDYNPVWLLAKLVTNWLYLLSMVL